MKYCISCGAQINVINPKFCPECGYSFASGDKSEHPPLKDKGDEERLFVEKEFAKPEVTIDMGFNKPIKLGEVIKQGEGSKEEEGAVKRQPDKSSKMSREEILKSLVKECGPTKRDKEISED